jgi:hypothetical protein
MPTTQLGSIRLIPRDLVNRFKAPYESATFYKHLFFGVILCGGAGVFLTILKPQWVMEDFSAALLGYFPALVGGAVLEFTEEQQPYLRSFGFLALCLLLPLTVVAVRTQHGWQLLWCITGTILSILLWWVANGLDNRFNDVTAQSALGGDVSSGLPQSTETGWKK